MSRDLLYKPPVPQVLPDEPAERKKGEAQAKLPDKSVNKLGLPQRGRDLGGTKDGPSDKGAKSGVAKGDAAASGDTAALAAAVLAAAATPERRPAHQDAYFTKDIEATAAVNQRASEMKALRGAEGATDLRRLVLPTSDVEIPNPDTLRAAGDLMMLQGEPELADMLHRQGSFARGQNVTVEMIQARMAQLEAMIGARVAALGRMARLPADRLERSPTLRHAAQAQGAALETSEDLDQEGNDLMRGALKQADGMHKRLAKTLGIKKKKR